MGWNSATIDALNAKLVSLGIEPIQPTLGWNRTVLDLLGALAEAGTGVVLPTHITQDWNSEFLYRLSMLLDAMGGGALRQVSPLDMALVDVDGIVKTQAYDAETGIWTIVTNEAGANETGGKAIVSTTPGTAAAFWLLPILDFDDGERMSGLDVGLDNLNDPTSASNLRVAAGYAQAPNATAVSVGYNHATAQTVLDVQGNLTLQSRTLVAAGRQRAPFSFIHNTTIHYWSRTNYYSYPADSSAGPFGTVTSAAHNSTINPIYLAFSLRPVGLVPNNTTVQVRLKYRKHRRPEDWLYAP